MVVRAVVKNRYRLPVGTHTYAQEAGLWTLGPIHLPCDTGEASVLG